MQFIIYDIYNFPDRVLINREIIIDTSAILSGKLNIWENDYIYPDSVIKELRSGSLEKILEVADIKTCKH